MTLKDGVVYTVGAIAILFAIAYLYWMWMYLVRGWGAYALGNALKMGLIMLFLFGLMWVVRREPDQA